MTTAAPRLMPGAPDPHHPGDPDRSSLGLEENVPSLISDSLDIAESMVTVIRAHHWLKTRLAEFEPEIGTVVLLIKLTKEGPRRAGELAEMTCSDPSTISRQVAALVKAGLVERKADPADGRASILVPTEAGHTRVQEFAAVRARAVEPIVSTWSAQERSVFIDLLSRYTAGLNVQREQMTAGHVGVHTSFLSDPPISPPAVSPPAASPPAVSQQPVPQQSVPDPERFPS